MWAILNIFFPGVCLNCSRSRVRWGLCQDCLDQVLQTGLNACIRCGRRCWVGDCTNPHHLYQRVLSIAEYRGPWRGVVKAVKFGLDRQTAQELARELASLAKKSGLALPQAIAIAPSAKKHWRFFDVTSIMADELSRITGAPIIDCLGRKPGRPPQVKLSKAQRIQGLGKYIYIKSPPPKGGIIWLVDDVFTTGSTAHACAKALVEAGASGIYVFVLAV